ncbi:energy transducer TonB, partial [Allosphingosinicella sp.]|uniref:energy transducer TonB n=1 Tax=Allosphingosinicella sp. TaxID=2823234 RepID=UPI002EEB8A55
MAIVTLALLALQAAPGPATPPRPIEPGGWIGMGDYPAPALRSETSGAVEVRLAVDGQGRVTGCEITRSAGRVLDEATCRLLRERARFQPGRDSTGAPVRSTHRTRIEWQLPGVETPVPVPFAPSRVLVTTFTPNRGTPYCRIETHGQPPGPILLTGCAPRTIPDQPPQVPGGYMWATTMLLPDGQEPAFEASPPGRIIVRTRV